jgi:hypothetical protein
MRFPTEPSLGSDGAELPWVETLWSGTCPADKMPAWAVEIAALIESARGPATADEHTAEPVVVARMQAATDRGADCPVPPGTLHPGTAAATDGGLVRDDVTQFVVRRRRSAQAVYRAAVAKAAVVVGVLALAAATATGGPAALASFVENWIDSFLPGAAPAPSIEAPGQGQEDADRGEGGQPSTRRSQRTAGDGSPSTSGNDPTRDRQASAPGQDTSVSGVPNRQALPPGHGDAVTGQGTPPGPTDPPTSAGSEDPAGGSAGHSSGSPPGHTGTPLGHAGPPGGGPAGGGAGPAGGKGEPPGLAGSSPAQSGGAPEQSGAARGHGGSALGQDGGSPGQSGGAPGQNGPASRPGGAAGPNGGGPLADVPILGVVVRTVTSVPAGG